MGLMSENGNSPPCSAKPYVLSGLMNNKFIIMRRLSVRRFAALLVGVSMF